MNAQQLCALKIGHPQLPFEFDAHLDICAAWNIVGSHDERALTEWANFRREFMHLVVIYQDVIGTLEFWIIQ
jgi:hypothetical protein